MPVSRLNRVVLPAPLGPTMPVMDPASALNDTLSTAVTPPNDLVSSRASSRHPDTDLPLLLAPGGDAPQPRDRAEHAAEHAARRQAEHHDDQDAFEHRGPLLEPLRDRGQVGEERAAEYRPEDGPRAAEHGGDDQRERLPQADLARRQEVQVERVEGAGQAGQGGRVEHRVVPVPA